MSCNKVKSFKNPLHDNKDCVILEVKEGNDHTKQKFFLGLDFLKNIIKEGLQSNNSVLKDNCNQLLLFLKENNVYQE